MKKITKLGMIAATAAMILPFSASAIKSPALKHLEVETNGGVGVMDVNKKNQSFTLFTPYNYTNIIAEAADESYKIEGAGKVDIKYGSNTIKVTVTDPSDNSSEVYTINLKAVEKSGTSNNNASTGTGDVIENPKTGAFVSTSILLGGLGLGIAASKGQKKKIHKI